MSDFVTRLAERAKGSAPVVQPLIASMFAPEPTSRWPEPVSEGEVAPSSGDPDRMTHHRGRETPLVSDAPEPAPDDAAMTRSEEQDTSARVTLPPSEAAEDPLPGPRHSAEFESSRRGTASERGDPTTLPNTPGLRKRTGNSGESGPSETEAGHEDQRSLSSSRFEPGPRLLPSGEPDSSEREAAFGRSRRDSPLIVTDDRIPLPEPRSGTLHRVEPAPARRGVDKAPPRLAPEDFPSGSFAAEDGPGQTVLRSTGTLAEHGRDITPLPAPPSSAGDSPKTGEGTLESEIPPAHPASPTATPLVVPRIVRQQPDHHQERDPRQPHLSAPEPPAPTIRVAIGRIEVRAITPPPAPPARRETTARSGPPLSLDDYLKQRNGGQR